MEVFAKPSGKIIKHENGYSFFLPNKLPPVIEYDEGLKLSTYLCAYANKIGNQIY
jgi:hypothetical protein